MNNQVIKPILARLKLILQSMFSNKPEAVREKEKWKPNDKEELELDKLSLLWQYFEWIRILGEGSFGKVYLIRNKRTKKEYALKQYNRFHLQKHRKFRSLVRSIYILHRLRHPNIIRCVNYIISPQQDGTIYMIFDACKKGSLSDIKKDLTPNKLNNLIRFILYQLAEGLSYLKAMKVAHRDLKPSNITFNSEGQLKIIDFDQAVCFDQEFPNVSQFKMLKDFGVNLSQVPIFFRSNKSRASNFVGTQFYMSPQMIQNTVCDQKGDMWAFGCIVYELLVGDYLHIEFDSQQLFQQEISMRLSSLRKACSDTSALDLFSSIVRFNPNDRIDIDSVLTHPYFAELTQPENKQKVRLQFVRFLRLNNNISKERSYVSYSVDGLNLPRGLEIFTQVKTMILVNVGKSYEFYQLISGPSYFKFKHVKQMKLDFYVSYSKIDRIIKLNDLLYLYYYSKSSDEIIQNRVFKHLYPNMIEQLKSIIELVIKD